MGQLRRRARLRSRYPLLASWLGHRLARYLKQSIRRYEPFAISDPQVVLVQ